MIETKILVSDPVGDYGSFKIIITECSGFSVGLIGGKYLFSVPQYSWSYLAEGELTEEKEAWQGKIPDNLPQPIRDHLAECLMRYAKALKDKGEEK